jgi:hypothetical protein
MFKIQYSDTVRNDSSVHIVNSIYSDSIQYIQNAWSVYKTKSYPTISRQNNAFFPGIFSIENAQIQVREVSDFYWKTLSKNRSPIYFLLSIHR